MASAPGSGLEPGADGDALVPARPWPGRPGPLGVTWDGEGVNVALFSEAATAVTVCLFGDDGRETRIPLEESTFHVWHGYLPQVSPGQLYGFRVDGPYDPAHGHRFDPSKLLVYPCARALDGELVLGLDEHASRELGRRARKRTSPGSVRFSSSR